MSAYDLVPSPNDYYADMEVTLSSPQLLSTHVSVEPIGHDAIFPEIFGSESPTPKSHIATHVTGSPLINNHAQAPTPKDRVVQGSTNSQNTTPRDETFLGSQNHFPFTKQSQPTAIENLSDTLSESNKHAATGNSDDKSTSLNSIALTDISGNPQTAVMSVDSQPAGDIEVNADAFTGKQPPQHTISTAGISSFMSIHDVISHLEAHGCTNIAQQLDEGSFDSSPFANGGFGDIYRAKLKDGADVAIKAIRFRVNSDETQKTLKHAARELYTWSKCRHPNVQQLLGLVEFRNQIGMVSAWETNGNLKDYIQQNPGLDRCQLSVQVAEGLAYLHEIGIIHGDLKASNVLVTEHGVPLLADFGNSTLKEYTLEFTGTSTPASVSMRWAAPEILHGTEARSIPADVYALGMETITGNAPWVGKNELAVMTSVLYKKNHPERPIIHIPYDCEHGNTLWSILKRCWSHDPKARPSSKEVKDTMQEMTPEGLTAVPGRTWSMRGTNMSMARSRSPSPADI